MYYSIITAYMNWLTDNISSNYLKYAVESNLEEAYKPLELNPKIIENSLRAIFYSRKDELDNLSNEEIIDILNKEFIKAKVIFIQFSDSKLNVDVIPKYKECGIVYAETDEQIEIYVNDTFFDILRKINTQNNDINKLCNCIYSLYSHEATHINQKEVEKVKQQGIDINNIRTNLEKQKYLANVRELAAHAREIANQLLLTNKSVKEIQELLTTRKGNEYLCKEYPMYNEYWNAFGIAMDMPKKYKDTDKDIQWRIRTFNRFKKYIVYFLTLDLKFIYHDDLKYTFGDSY